MEIQNKKILFKKEPKSSLFFEKTQVVPEQIELASLEVEPDLPVGEIIPSVDAVGWLGRRNVDIRPRLVDKSSGEARLLDSGAQLSATMKKRHVGSKLMPFCRRKCVLKSQIDVNST